MNVYCIDLLWSEVESHICSNQLKCNLWYYIVWLIDYRACDVIGINQKHKSRIFPIINHFEKKSFILLFWKYPHYTSISVSLLIGQKKDENISPFVTVWYTISQTQSIIRYTSFKSKSSVIYIWIKAPVENTYKISKVSIPQSIWLMFAQR